MDMERIAGLVGRARENDEEARSDLCRETYNLGYFSALKLVKNPDDALDIVQEAYLRAFSNLGSLQRDEAFVKWLLCIVMNLTKNYLKKKKPTLFVEMRDEDAGDLEFRDDDIAFQPDQKLDSAETRHLVDRMVESLPEEQRICVMMYYFNELSVAEIAMALDVSENTVKSRLNYGRKKIKSQVLDLEKQQGLKLYSLAPIPFVVWMLEQEAKAAVLPAAVVETLAATVSGKSAVVATSASTAGAAGTAGGAAVTVAGTATKALSLKLIAGILAGIIAVGGAVAGVAYAVNNRNSSGRLDEVLEVHDGLEEESESEMGLEDLSGTFTYDFHGYPLEFPKEWEKDLVFWETDAGSNALGRLGLYYRPLIEDLLDENGKIPADILDGGIREITGTFCAFTMYYNELGSFEQSAYRDLLRANDNISDSIQRREQMRDAWIVDPPMSIFDFHVEYPVHFYSYSPLNHFVAYRANIDQRNQERTLADPSDERYWEIKNALDEKYLVLFRELYPSPDLRYPMGYYEAQEDVELPEDLRAWEDVEEQRQDTQQDQEDQLEDPALSGDAYAYRFLGRDIQFPGDWGDKLVFVERTNVNGVTSLYAYDRDYYNAYGATLSEEELSVQFIVTEWYTLEEAVEDLWEMENGGRSATYIYADYENNAFAVVYPRTDTDPRGMEFPNYNDQELIPYIVQITQEAREYLRAQ